MIPIPHTVLNIYLSMCNRHNVHHLHLCINNNISNNHVNTFRKSRIIKMNCIGPTEFNFDLKNPIIIQSMFESNDKIQSHLEKVLIYWIHN